MTKNRIIVFGALLLTGCAVRQEIAAIKADSSYLRRQVDSLRVEQRRLRAELATLRTLTEESTEASNRMRADVQFQMNQVAEQTQLLSDRLEDTGRRISNLPAKLRFAAPLPMSAAPDTARKTAAADTSQAAMPTTPPPNPISPAEAQQLYDAAYQDLVKGQFELARQGFMQYLHALPQGALADNAHYWIGESHYSQKNYEPAMQEFSVVLEKFPDGDKVPSAMLKRAYSQLALGQTAAGKENLQALIKRFPQSNEAKLAKAKLQELAR
jgi:tol-pal system protein YbgF